MNDILRNREELSKELLEDIRPVVSDWGVDVESIRLKDIVFDDSMTRVMAKSAEAERIADAKIINADVDVKTAKKYAEASEIFKNDPTAMRLRELEAFGRMAGEKSNTIAIIPTRILDLMKEIRTQ